MEIGNRLKPGAGRRIDKKAELGPRAGRIALGGAIGTGLFLGSAIAVRTAGPGVILTYIFAAIITLLLMACLAEMAVAHPPAGAFGIYAELFVLRWAGFVLRYPYLLA
ncbi:amino acid permease, partial [Lacticaseibacillus rhamnosus]